MQDFGKGLRLLTIWGFTISALGFLSIGYFLAIFAAMVLGAGASGGGEMVLNELRPIGRIALAFILGSAIPASIAALVSSNKYWLPMVLTASSTGGIAAVLITPIKDIVVSQTCAALAWLDIWVSCL